MITKYTKEMAGNKRLSDVTASNIELQGKRRRISLKYKTCDERYRVDDDCLKYNFSSAN